MRLKLPSDFLITYRYYAFNISMTKFIYEYLTAISKIAMTGNNLSLGIIMRPTKITASAY